MKRRCSFPDCRRYRVEEYDFCADHIPRCPSPDGDGICGQRVMPGLHVCGSHGGHLPRVVNKAREVRLMSAEKIEATAAAIIERGVDELGVLKDLLATSAAAVELLHRELSSGSCEHCGRSGIKALNEGLSSLEKWTGRTESLAVSSRKLRMDTRFRRLADNLVKVFADWLIQYVPEHRREAALRDLERTKSEVFKQIA